MELSDWKKILPGFVPYNFAPEDSFNPKNDDEKEKILALRGDERSQALNSHLQDSIDGIQDGLDDLNYELENKVEVSDDVLSTLCCALLPVNEDIQAMAYY